jgi:hypothetical protein
LESGFLHVEVRRRKLVRLDLKRQDIPWDRIFS